MRCLYWTVTLAAAAWPLVAWAGRPLVIDDAEPVGFAEGEFELGISYLNFTDADHFDFPVALTIGVAPRLELGVGFGGQFEEREESQGFRRHASGLGDLVVAGKWKFLDEGSWLPAQSLAPAVKFPTADRSNGLGSGEVDYDVSWIASKGITDKLGVHFNAGYSWIGSQDGESLGDIVHYGMAVDYQLLDAVQWVGEVFAQKERLGGSKTILQYNTGVRWSAMRTLTLDAAAGSAFRGDGPDFFVTLGLTWTFDFRRNKD